MLAKKQSFLYIFLKEKTTSTCLSARYVKKIVCNDGEGSAKLKSLSLRI